MRAHRGVPVWPASLVVQRPVMLVSNVSLNRRGERHRAQDADARRGHVDVRRRRSSRSPPACPWSRSPPRRSCSPRPESWPGCTGRAATVSLLAPSLPAATRNKRAGRRLDGVVVASSRCPAPPRLTLATLAPILPAYTNPSAMPAMLPEPAALRTLIATIFGPNQVARGRRERGHARDAERVVGARRDRAGDVRPVMVVVVRVVVVVDEVPAAEVVDAAVGVVVDAVGLLAAAALTRVGEHVRGQIGMGARDAGVDDRHPHGGDRGRRPCSTPRARRCRRRRCRPRR